jgi:hypothetical protein
VSDRNKRRAALLVALACLVSALATARYVAAQGVCLVAPGGSGPQRRAESHVDGWAVQAVGEFDCRRGVRVEVDAGRKIPEQVAAGPSDPHPLSRSGVIVVPIHCRRDDYMFLPPTSLGGLPCVGVPETDHFDPLSLEVRMAKELPPPELRIGMNPARGMVAVPTWFRVEGYDGGMLAQSETVVEAHKLCHVVAVRDARGRPVLGEDGRPRTQTNCTIETTTFVVDVRLWPSRFAWDFGDGHVWNATCPSQEYCGDALGQPFVDSAHPSPVRHLYNWSSLGVNGALDAYSINLGITFGAQYRVSINGNGAGWQTLSERLLTWNANHQVQEAQAVLTRP